MALWTGYGAIDSRSYGNMMGLRSRHGMGLNDGPRIAAQSARVLAAGRQDITWKPMLGDATPSARKETLVDTSSAVLGSACSSSRGWLSSHDVVSSLVARSMYRWPRGPHSSPLMADSNGPNLQVTLPSKSSTRRLLWFTY